MSYLAIKYGNEAPHGRLFTMCDERSTEDENISE